MEEERASLRSALEITDTSLGFLLLIVAAILLSFLSVSVQRRGLCLTLRGEADRAAALPPVYPIDRTARAMLVGALGYFLWVSVHNVGEADRGEDAVAQRSARTSLWAAIFVLAAALLRLEDLDFVARSRQSEALEEAVGPA